MSEDETFRRLRKIPYEQLRERLIFTELNDNNREAFLEECGWTTEEISEKLLEEIHKLRDLSKFS